MTAPRFRIEKVVHRGYGLGRVEGRVWLVPFSAPGDLLLARATRDRGGHVEGEVIEVLEEGPGRTTPPCRLYGRCGGCHLQHLDQEAQARIKADVLEEALSRAHVETPKIRTVQGEVWSWRSRATFHVDGGRIGFYERGTRQIVEMPECPLLADEISSLITPIRESLAGLGMERSLELELLADDTGGVVAVVRGEGRWIRQAADPLVRIPGIKGCLAGSRAKRGHRWHRRGTTDLTWSTLSAAGESIPVVSDARCFSQAHRTLNASLVRTVMDFCAPSPGERILELYAGAGNLSVPLAQSGADLVTVESDQRSSLAAKAAIGALGTRSVRTVTGRAEDMVARTARMGPAPDLVVADPPRSGMKKLLPDLVRLHPARLVFCSCEPSSLARDLAFLSSAGYAIDRIAMIDMFPQTYHLETVVRLKGA